MNAEAALEQRLSNRAYNPRTSGRKTSPKVSVPIVDVFAGCGGFSEGFLRYVEGRHKFALAMAVDNDEAAHKTHLLRAFFHQFREPPLEYYEMVRQERTIPELFERFPLAAERAREQVVLHELGASTEADSELHKRIHSNLKGRENWVLLGGPPCQAYSVAGRSRNRGNKKYKPEQDQRHFLYREYLKILAELWPAVFVMENVPGMLHSRVGGEPIWHRVLEDLTDPVTAIGAVELDGRYDGYRLFSLVSPDRGLDVFGVPVLHPEDYVVRCEEYGIPQARHRIFILGVRADLIEMGVKPRLLVPANNSVPCGKVLQDLPRLRSGLTKLSDDDENWRSVMQQLVEAKWWKKYSRQHASTLAEARRILRKIVLPEGGRGGQFVAKSASVDNQIPKHLKKWLLDERLGGACNHESKAHMESDVHRYVFAACYARASSEPFRLVHFPEELLPEHENIRDADRRKLSHSNFSDRFAVQRADEPARTVVSHISKDGHYYIHPDATQGRSLTVREAARIQTFQDNYYFPGPRTEQYRQVGNAVPPYLGWQIAGIVDDVLEQTERQL